MYWKSIGDTNCSGVRSAASFQTGFFSAWAEVPERVDARPQREVGDALLRAEPAELAFLGEAAPNAPMSAVIDSSVLPTTIGVRRSTAFTTTSVPRPRVNVRPWPSRAAVVESAT